MDDTSTAKGIIDAAYALISGRAGEPRDWDRWRSLHAPGARLIAIEISEDGAPFARVMSTEDFIASRSPFFEKNNFYEWETASEEKRFGALVQVWSSYDASLEQGGAPIRRGVNSIQLWHDGSRWWMKARARKTARISLTSFRSPQCASQIRRASSGRRRFDNRRYWRSARGNARRDQCRTTSVVHC